ncbi:hypothetical protein [Burkholderia thailandensis]|uniref:SH3 domain-containing protein n=1 Tax=Burkholderia thailandensis TaxID=57975 RepID=A0AAW9CJY2_BURTH|nr:hypothetical protein [Burkholderia thailandensis]AHI68406.1 hypothetical protein BTL_5411 [Burkholderia thailandensis H0587]AIP65516.1 hypothetical protein DR62_5211 [Burkholderia thailandensis]AJY32651.1 hypothetical protein BTM_4163 [Burkholderia thailandensis 34]MCS3392406.1 hypothetical protein [Burkholderia thailandensis]MCS6425313.1 hypothetical protein [Burkholderia thailandensis]
MERQRKNDAEHHDKRTMAQKLSMSVWGAGLALCAGFAATNVHAKDAVDCRRLNSATSGPDGNFRPPLSATVTGSGRAYFHSAPASACVTRRIFVVPGDIVTVYKPYQHWYQVMYVNGKTGEDFEGWVEESRLRPGASLGGGQ